MSDEGEKTCPLCAEEMDLTDQQLKPCKCGYEICVWCWHHIIEMAEKDESEGRCPACRASYDKEKIVGMSSKCESKLVAEIQMERKVKSKAKAKTTTDGRKQLSSVRVIQRNLVYIVGLPLNLADEELLQRRDYFGQYGKVLKVSMSRNAAGVIQQYQNNSCSVYITYSKEDEAIRCIQNVHGFVLDGRPLRACFGTTKYCHAWLRNAPCTNQDCLYLHEVGSHEDSFTKDEIISAYTRSRVQQITGAANNVQRRSGNALPPPLDDYCNNSSASSGKPIVKNGTTTTGNVSKGSPPNGSTGRSAALPAAASWGMRGSNCQPLVNGPSKQKPDMVSNGLSFSSAIVGPTQSSVVHGDGVKRQSLVLEGHSVEAKDKPEAPSLNIPYSAWDCQDSVPEKTAVLDGSLSVSLGNQLSNPLMTKDNHRQISVPSSISDSTDQDGQSSSSSGHENDLMFASDGILCSELSSLCMESNTMEDHSGITTRSGSFSDHSMKPPQAEGLLQQCYSKQQSRESPTASQQVVSSVNGVCDSGDRSEWMPSSQVLVVNPNTPSEMEADIISFDNQRLKDPEVVTHSSYLPNTTNSLHSANHLFSHLQHPEAHAAVNSNSCRLFMDSKIRDSPFGCTSTAVMSSGYSNNLVNSFIGSERNLEHAFLHPHEDKVRHNGRLVGEARDAEINSPPVDKGESSIISNILSLDFDSWDESLRSPQNLAKLLGDEDQQPGNHRMSSSWKPQPNNQSRFSFARQEESVNQGLNVQPSQSIFSQSSINRSFSHDFADNRELYFDKHGMGNGFSGSSAESENFTSNNSAFPPSKPAVSRAPISAPPGFKVPSRAPPPGFSSLERMDHASFDSLHGNRFLESSSLMRNGYQQQVTGNLGSPTDIEFMDPAILAVGKGRLQGSGLNNPGLEMRSNSFQSSQLNPFENDARLQLLMSRSLSQQSHRFPENFSHLNDSYGLSSRLVDQTQVNNVSPFAQMSHQQQSRNVPMSNNGLWDGWNNEGCQGGNSLGGNLGMADLLRNERVGFGKFYGAGGGGGGGYEDSKFRMPSSDLYNRTFGM